MLCVYVAEGLGADQAAAHGHGPLVRVAVDLLLRPKRTEKPIRRHRNNVSLYAEDSDMDRVL